MKIDSVELIAPVYDARAEFARDVRLGLGKPGQKELPSTYLYDEMGTALFEAITHLPEYGLTRADERLLRRHSGEIATRLPASTMIAELGSGSGKKNPLCPGSLLPGEGSGLFPDRRFRYGVERVRDGAVTRCSGHPAGADLF